MFSFLSTLFPTGLEIWNKSLGLGLKIFFYQLVLSTVPAAANCPTGNLYVTSRGIFTPSYTENVLIKVVVQQKDILGVICIKYISFSWSNPYIQETYFFYLTNPETSMAYLTTLGALDYFQEQDPNLVALTLSQVLGKKNYSPNLFLLPNNPDS